MAIQIIKENTNVSLINTADSSKIATFDMYTFTFTEHETDVYLISDVSSSALVATADAVDDNGDTFADSATLIAYLESTSREGPNLGTSLRLDNIELSNTGAHLKMVNVNTQEETFMVQQRVDPNLGTTSVYYVEQTTEVQRETSADAYQPYSMHTGKGTLNAQGRNALALDISVIQDTFVHEYRSILNTDIENLNIKIFSVTQSPEDLTKYRSLTGANIVTGWYISKRPYWTLNKQATIDTKAGQFIASGNAALPFVEGFSLKSGGFYRFVISGDNDFEFQGVNGVPNPFGGTQFIPYIERSFTGEVEVNVKTEGAKTHRSALDFYRDGTDTSIILSDGESYNVNTIKAVADNGTIKIISVDDNATITHYRQCDHELVTIAGGTAGNNLNDVVDNLNALFAVQPLGLGGSYISTLPTLAGAAITANFAEGQDPIGDSIYSVGTSTGQHDARVWSTETIDSLGEFYEVKITGKGQFMLGLYSVADGDLDEITNNVGNGHSGYKWAQAFYNYGSYVAPWTYYGSNSSSAIKEGWTGSTSQQFRYNTIVQDNLANADAANPVLFKIGITAEGYIACWYFDEGRSNQYIMTARSSYTLTEGQYGLMVKLVNGTVQLIEAPQRTATDPTAPILTYRFIESPDGVFHYPLFSTEEEANYYDSLNGGSGSGTSHTHVYVDEPTTTTWYMPDNGSTMSGTAAPVNTSVITYNEILTLADSLFVPTAFADNTITVSEGDALNLQLHPSGNTGYTTTIGGIPAFTLVNGYLQGTAPEVTGDNAANPSDTTTVTVYRTNSFGTSQGTLTIVINNLTAPIVTPITGITDEGGTALVDSNTMDDGSAISIDNVVNVGNRFVFLKEWLDTYVLPKITAGTGAKAVWLGFANSPDFTSIGGSDFSLAYRFYCDDTTRASNSWKLQVWENGNTNQNIGIGGLSSGLYNYALINDGTELKLGAIVASQSQYNITTEVYATSSPWNYTDSLTGVTSASKKIYIATENTDLDLDLQHFLEVAEPVAPVSSLTNWTKAIDFSGSNEHLKLVSSHNLNSALRMQGIATTAGAPVTAGNTSNNSNARPWATSIVFKTDGNNSNQHIWNQGGGASDDNIYLRVSANKNLFLGWGRDGTGVNECRIAANLNTSHWYGVYIASTGERLSASNATGSSLAAAFDIRLASSEYGFPSVGSNLSTPDNWGVYGSTGQRMDRNYSGDFTIGGRGSNRNFHGKVASMIVTTLKNNQAMPTTSEIQKMITDPVGWVTDFKLGSTFMSTGQTGGGSMQFPYSVPTTNYAAIRSTQVWLMGDGSADSYANGIRSYIYPTDQNNVKLQLNSMVSNDIETVSINGLS